MHIHCTWCTATGGVLFDGHCTVLENLISNGLLLGHIKLTTDACAKPVVVVLSVAGYHDQACAERFVVVPPAGDYDDGGMITSEAYVRYAREWVAAGASIVGGCCGIGPAHMKAVREAFQAADAGQ